MLTTPDRTFVASPFLNLASSSPHPFVNQPIATPHHCDHCACVGSDCQPHGHCPHMLPILYQRNIPFLVRERTRDYGNLTTLQRTTTDFGEVADLLPRNAPVTYRSSGLSPTGFRIRTASLARTVPGRHELQWSQQPSFPSTPLTRLVPCSLIRPNHCDDSLTPIPKPPSHHFEVPERLAPEPQSISTVASGETPYF